MIVEKEMVVLVFKPEGKPKETLVFHSRTAATRWVNAQKKPEQYEVVYKSVRRR